MPLQTSEFRKERGDSKRAGLTQFFLFILNNQVNTLESAPREERAGRGAADIDKESELELHLAVSTTLLLLFPRGLVGVVVFEKETFLLDTRVVLPA